MTSGKFIWGCRTYCAYLYVQNLIDEVTSTLFSFAMILRGQFVLFRQNRVLEWRGRNCLSRSRIFCERVEELQFCSKIHVVVPWQDPFLLVACLVTLLCCRFSVETRCLVVHVIQNFVLPKQCIVSTVCNGRHFSRNVMSFSLRDKC